MKRRWFSVLVVTALLAGTARAQDPHGRPWSSQMVVPQARLYGLPHSAALQITGVTVGVVIRDRIATTMMEIHAAQPERDAAGGRAARSRARRRGGARVRVPGQRRGAVGPAALAGRGAADL